MDIVLNKVDLALLNLFSSGYTMRSRREKDCIAVFKPAFELTPFYALKCLFYLRSSSDQRKNKRFFKICYRWLAYNYPDCAKKNLHLIPKFGDWGDLYFFFQTPIEEDILSLLRKQLLEDYKKKKKKQSISFLSDWLPTCWTTNPFLKEIAQKIYSGLGWSEFKYQRIVSSLRKYNKKEQPILEWENTEPSFYKKIHYICRRIILNRKGEYVYAGDEKDYELLEKLWDSFFRNCPLNAFCIIDNSSSMNGTPLEIATTLCIACSEKLEGAFHNKYLTFNHELGIRELVKKNRIEQIIDLMQQPILSTIDLEKVSEELLYFIKQNKILQKNIPKHLILVTDKTFVEVLDCKTQEALSNLITNLELKWACEGYVLPRLVFWNADLRENTFPMIATQRYTLLNGIDPILYRGLLLEESAIKMMYRILNQNKFKEII